MAFSPAGCRCSFSNCSSRYEPAARPPRLPVPRPSRASSARKLTVCCIWSDEIDFNTAASVLTSAAEAIAAENSTTEPSKNFVAALTVASIRCFIV